MFVHNRDFGVLLTDILLSILPGDCINFREHPVQVWGSELEGGMVDPLLSDDVRGGEEVRNPAMDAEFLGHP